LGKGKRIGILGGTFNPPHIGHLVLAQEALKQLNLEKIIFIPTFIPPHKKVKDNNAYVRYRMAALSCAGNPHFEASRIELKRRSVSYSVDTLQALKNKYGKNAKLFFITGSDSLGELESWRKIGRILKLATFVIAVRPGFPVRKTKRKIKFIRIPEVGLSSSMIRDRVRRLQPIKYMVPEPVRKFIIKHRLYK